MCLGQGLANFFCKESDKSFCLWAIHSLSQLLNSAIVEWKQQWTKCKWVDLTVFQQKLIYKNRQGARFGPWACLLFLWSRLWDESNPWVPSTQQPQEMWEEAEGGSWALKGFSVSTKRCRRSCVDWRAGQASNTSATSLEEWRLETKTNGEFYVSTSQHRWTLVTAGREFLPRF